MLLRNKANCVDMHVSIVEFFIRSVNQSRWMKIEWFKSQMCALSIVY